MLLLLSIRVTWSNLPASVVESDTIRTFRNCLDNHWEVYPLRYHFLATTPNGQTHAVRDNDVEIGPQAMPCPITSISISKIMYLYKMN